MSGTLFAATCIVAVFAICFFNRRKIKKYLNNSVYYYCWAIMLVSNLGFSNNIQYLCRGGALVISWFCIFINERCGLKIKKCNIGVMLVIYLILCAVSTVYSVSSVQTLFKCVELFTDLILIWLLYTKEDRNDFVIKTLNVTVIVFFVLLTITLIGFFVLPSFFRDNGYQATRSFLGIRLGGGLLGANKSSALAALGIMWILLLKYKSDIWFYGMLFVCAGVMFFSQSRATLILVPIILFLKLYKPKEKYKLFYIGLIIVVVVLVAMNFDLIYSYLLRGQSETQLLSGTGRANIWNSAKDYIAAKPVLGYGFGAGGELVATRIYGVATMHSAIYETLLGTGAIGLILLAVQYLYVFIVVVRNTLKYGFKNNTADLILILYFLIRSVTSVGIGNWHSQEVMVWYYFMFALSKGRSIQRVYLDKYQEEL